MSLSPCLFHIVCCICCSFLYICINIFSNVIYIFCLHVVLTKSHLFSLLFVTLSLLYSQCKSLFNFPTPARNSRGKVFARKVEILLIFFGQLHPYQRKLVLFSPALFAPHLSMYLWGWIYSLPIHSGNLNVSSSANCTRVWNAEN